MVLESAQSPPLSLGHNADESSTLSVELLRIENRLLERYMQDKGVALPDWTSLLDNTDDIVKSVSTQIEVKLQIAIESLSKINDLLENKKEAAERLVSTMKVMLDETDLRIGDIQKDAYNFKRDVVDGGRCARNRDRYKAEKLTRYFDQKIYDQESCVDKLRLLNNTLVERKRRLESQLSLEDDVSFHFIDYQEMQIRQKENKNLSETKSAQVALYKIATEKAKQHILSLQSELEVLKSKAAANEKKLELREKFSSRLDEITQVKQVEVKALQDVLTGNETSDDIITTARHAQTNGLDIMRYITQKAEIHELQKKIKTTERKITIAKGNRKL
ncbi:hypothetical protein HJC23_010481 [Cyclotella cryptica]|uniref:DUF4201 domain-containing protein n=1 Tax=Cyclotella cryptica TaxID=29204 RepID=A0ABD3QH82_9STRA|eukprot:CCRYP_007056-RA/>CCRYP_007056-RA protein AED:0.37 eAED:0.37 QI:0/0/0/1/1/1/2/0/331